MSSPFAHIPSGRSRRNRIAAGALLCATGLVGTYLAAIRPQPSYAAGSTPRSGQVTPLTLPPYCPAAPVGWDDTYVSTAAALEAAVTTADDQTFICVTESITLTGPLAIDDTTLTLAGRDDSEVSLHAAAVNRHFQIRLDLAAGQDDTVTLSHLKLAGGSTGSAGGSIEASMVYTTGDDTDVIVLQGTTFTDNNAGNYGGAIYCQQGIIRISDSTFSGNTLGDDYGGAIAGRDGCSLSISESYFVANAAGSSAGYGGAIALEDGYLTIASSTFHNNTSNQTGGGAIDIDGTLTYITASAFTSNVTLLGSGGAIRARAIDDTVSISSSVFADDSAPSGTGGAIHFYGLATGSLRISDSTFAENSSSNKGGALWIAGAAGSSAYLSNSTLVGNNTSTTGGAVGWTRPRGVISSSTMTGNSANVAGGLYLSTENYPVSISNSIVAGNTSNFDGDDILDDLPNRSTLNYSAVTSLNVSSIKGVAAGTGVVAVDEATQLGALVDNGGTRVGVAGTYLPTRVPVSGSSLLNAGNQAAPGLPAFDQRGAGFLRVVNGGLDLGAIEVQSATPPPPPSPTYPPSPPLNVVGTPGDASAAFTWDAPASSGSFSVTDYRVELTPGGQSCLTPVSTRTCEFTGLANGRTYIATVQALNGAGWSLSSDPSNPVTPISPVNPTIVITGTRFTSDPGRVSAQGVTTYLAGQRVQARVHLSGEPDYYAGSQRLVNDDNTFSWQRKTKKKVYVYFVTLDRQVRSNRVVIDP